jgi:AcrR family transcriptional regulator
MARPINANASRTRRKILAAAIKLFAEQGPLASMRAVARAADVSLATILHYFKNKDGLYQACIEAMDEQFVSLRKELATVVAAGGSIDEILETVVRRAYRFACDHVMAVRLTTRAAIEKGEITPARQQSMLVTGLDDGVALLGQLPGLDTEQLRLVLRSVTYLIVRYALTEPREQALALGWDPDDFDETACSEAVERHLVFAARALLAALVSGDD